MHFVNRLCALAGYILLADLSIVPPLLRARIASCISFLSTSIIEVKLLASTGFLHPMLCSMTWNSMFSEDDKFCLL